MEQEYLNVARQQGGTADSALQNALGVLYNLNRNYERAVDCIKTAIALKPEVGSMQTIRRKKDSTGPSTVESSWSDVGKWRSNARGCGSLSRSAAEIPDLRQGQIQSGNQLYAIG